MDHLEALLPPPPFDQGNMLPNPVTPPTHHPDNLSSAHLAALYTELRDLRRDCLQLARRARELPFTILGHNEIRAINARLETVRAVNRTLHPWHRSAAVTAWPTPPIPTTCLMCPADLIPWLTDALAVLAARQTWPLRPAAEATDALMLSPSHQSPSHHG
jgi:hypothetical protein